MEEREWGGGGGRREGFDRAQGRGEVSLRDEAVVVGGGWGEVGEPDSGNEGAGELAGVEAGEGENGKRFVEIERGKGGTERDVDGDVGGEGEGIEAAGRVVEGGLEDGSGGGDVAGYGVKWTAEDACVEKDDEEENEVAATLGARKRQAHRWRCRERS